MAISIPQIQPKKQAEPRGLLGTPRGALGLLAGVGGAVAGGIAGAPTGAGAIAGALGGFSGGKFVGDTLEGHLAEAPEQQRRPIATPQLNSPPPRNMVILENAIAAMPHLPRNIRSEYSRPMAEAYLETLKQYHGYA